ncbi:MAG: lipopolysaccharide heptosyltransferase I [Thermodesulfobacteriota bacterium]
MKILIVKTSAIGDVIHTLPALNCLRRHYPDARIDWLVEEAAAEAVIGHQAVDRVLVSGRKRWVAEFRQGRRLAALRGFLDFVRQLRATEYDLLIDLQGLLKSGIFVFLARARRKAGFGRGMEHAEGSWLFLNERIPAVDMNQHALTRELLLLGGLGIPCERIEFGLPVTDQHRAEVADLLGEAGISPKKTLVAINPMTTWPTKHWLGGRFAEVADHLLAMGLAVVFTGGPGDVAAIEAIQAAMTAKAPSLAGRTSLKTLAALYERARLLITTDTGPMHVAAAMDTPVVALFGPTAPWRTGPFGPNHRVLRVELACGPCLKRICPRDHECMTRLTVGQVVEAARSLLEARP